MKRRAGTPRDGTKKPARTMLRKGDVLMQAAEPPRTVWGAKSRKRKKM